MKTVTAIVLLTALMLSACASNGPVDRTIHKSYPLKHASAESVAQTLIREESPTPEFRVVIVADARMNSVVVRGTPEDLERLSKRIQELDVK